MTAVTEAAAPFPTFEVEILMELEWQDERLAWGDSGAKPHVYLEDEAQEALGKIYLDVNVRTVGRRRAQSR